MRTRADRAVTTTLGYALGLLITSLLISGLLIAGGSTVDTQQRRAVSNELQVVGQQLAADITAVDRLATTGETSVANVTSRLPSSLAGSGYRVTVAAAGGNQYELRLQSLDPRQSWTVRLVSKTPLAPTTVDGGRLDISYDPAADQLVIRNA